MKKVVLLFWFMLGLLTMQAQNGNPIQLEFPSTTYGNQLNHILCDRNGVCVLFESGTTDSITLHLEHYDVNFRPIRKQEIPLPANVVFVGATYDHGMAYILYQTKNKKKKENTGWLFSYNCQTQKVDSKEIHNMPEDDLKNLKSYQGNLYFTCVKDKNNENFYSLNAKDTHVKELFLPNAPDYTINDYLIDTLNQRLMICINTSSNSRNNVIWLCEADLNGNKQFVVDLPDTGSVRFQNARIEQLSQHKFFLAGTYQGRKGAVGNTAEGIYSTLYENRTFSNTELSPYSKDFYVSDPYGRTEMLYLPGRMFLDSTRVAYVTEAFFPEYRYSTSYAYGMPTTEAIFVGYHFLFADVNIFDTTGTKIWGYHFPFDNTVVTNLTTHLRVAFLNNQVLFYYQMGQSLYTMLTDNEMNVVDPMRQSTVFPKNPNSNQTKLTTSLRPWYDDYFLLVGYRFAKRGSSREKAPTYFLTKLRYE